MTRKSRTRGGFDLNQAADMLSNTRFRRIESQSLMQRRAQHAPAAQPRDIAEIRERITKAVTDCATWRAAGFSEKYLEAYSLIEALEAELTALVHAQDSARAIGAMRSPSEPAALPSTMSASGNRAQLMADLAIASDGRRY